MAFDFNIMRSLIYVDVVKEEYRVKLLHWLYAHHVPESISQFSPYVTKYAFYNALPSPDKEGRFGTVRMQLTEHYWLVDENLPEMSCRTIKEYFPTDVLKWQGNIPENAAEGNPTGDEARRSKGNGTTAHPFVFAFVPLCWESDLKGKGRTIEDGPNYRWQFLISYPEGISKECGDKWFFEEVVPYFQKDTRVNRLLSSAVKQDINDCRYVRAVEIWFDGPEEWEEVVEKGASVIKKPDWAQTPDFPYLLPYQNITGIFLADYVTSDNLTQYHGYQTLR
ncbi:MAG: acetyl-CoA hydrolase [Spirochaetia bacterium]|jgi:hypothetical protein|nr:acetyl-CoA hydrolase [Spirochaetia bacterium]